MLVVCSARRDNQITKQKLKLVLMWRLIGLTLALAIFCVVPHEAESYFPNNAFEVICAFLSQGIAETTGSGCGESLHTRLILLYVGFSALKTCDANDLVVLRDPRRFWRRHRFSDRAVAEPQTEQVGIGATDMVVLQCTIVF